MGKTSHSKKDFMFICSPWVCVGFLSVLGVQNNSPKTLCLDQLETLFRLPLGVWWFDGLCALSWTDSLSRVKSLFFAGDRHQQDIGDEVGKIIDGWLEMTIKIVKDCTCL